MPDWSAITQLVAREALGSIYDALDWSSKLADIGPTEDHVWRAAIDHFVEAGGGPTVDHLSRTTTLPPETVETALIALRARDVVVLDDAGARVAGAYPFSSRATGHVVEFDGHLLNAMCAIDALGVGAMYGRDVAIRSACRHCGQAVRVSTMGRGEAISAVEPEGAVVWSGIRYSDNCAANSLCRVLVFFCSDGHLQAWRDAHDPDAPGYRLTIDEALEVGKAIFRPIRSHPTPQVA